jgi:hypothetical protein
MKKSEVPTATGWRRRRLLGLGVIGTLASLFTIVALIGSGSALGDVNGCPLAGPAASSVVGRTDAG